MAPQALTFCQNMVINGAVIIPTLELTLVMNLAMLKCVHTLIQMVCGNTEFAALSMPCYEGAAYISWAFLYMECSFC